MNVASRPLNFIVLGAGAIGCYAGGRLAHAGHSVTLVGRPRVLGAIAALGLKVTDLEGFSAHLAAPVSAGNLRLAASLHEAKNQGHLNEDSVVLLCVKGGTTQVAAADIAVVCGPGITVMSLQNGVDNVARIRKAAPLVQTLAGMVPYNVVMPTAHQVHRASMGVLQIERSPASSRFTPLFNAAGLPTVLVDDMRAVQWGKLLLNLNNPVNALSNLPLQAQLSDRDYRFVLAGLQTEALQILALAGITPAKVTTLAPRVLPHVLRLPNWVFKRMAARMLRMDASARSSMWDDLNLGRTTEIDDLCGAVLRLATAQGQNAPFNQRMVQLIDERSKLAVANAANKAPGSLQNQMGMSGKAMRQEIFK